MVVAPIDHVSVDERGVAYISGTSIRVSDIVIDTYTWRLAPEAILENYPRITLAEIHSALAYYHDHVAAIDSQIAQSDQELEQARATAVGQPPRAVFEKRMSTSHASRG
jgi:uncharacterized protein (DUF433 family)